MVRLTSASRPISGSILPSMAFWLRLMQKLSSASPDFSPSPFLRLFQQLLRRAPCVRPAFGQARLLGNAVRNEVDRIVAGHVLLLQEVGGMAFALGKDCHQHVGAGYFFAARRLNVNDRALDHPLEARRRLGVLAGRHDQAGQVMIDVVLQAAAQLPRHRRRKRASPMRVLVVDSASSRCSSVAYS
jgi:hypothetical protein